jgi:hypothetical protein
MLSENAYYGHNTQKTTSFLYKAVFFRFQWADLKATSHQNHAAAAHVCTYLSRTD